MVLPNWKCARNENLLCISLSLISYAEFAILLVYYGLLRYLLYDNDPVHVLFDGKLISKLILKLTKIMYLSY